MKKNIFDKLENDVPMPKGGTPMGGKTIPVIKAGSQETVTVKGTKTMKKQKATWY